MSDNVPSSETPEPEKKTVRDSAPWLIGVVLIVIGIIFLLQNIRGFPIGNWWALFILIPAIGSLITAWRVYRANGRLTAAVRGPLVGGFILLLVACAFLFNLDWGKVWPFFLIIAGIGALLGALLR
jgi:hypothetical protein